MKVIFLDIDGVLNVISQGRDEYGSTFHKHFEDNLRTIVDATDAKLVISSTWRNSGLSVMKEMWRKRSLAGEVIDITPDLSDYNEETGLWSSKVRGDEIQAWLDEHEVEQYVIIDDDNDMLDSQRENFVRTADNQDHPDCIDIGYGLTKQCAELAIKILRTPKVITNLNEQH